MVIMRNTSLPDIDSLLLSALVAALEAAWEEGSPVVGWTNEGYAERASIALRRIRSFKRRGVRSQDRMAQIRDLAKGLANRFSTLPIGPEIRDYEYVAEKLLKAYETVLMENVISE